MGSEVERLVKPPPAGVLFLLCGVLSAPSRAQNVAFPAAQPVLSQVPPPMLGLPESAPVELDAPPRELRANVPSFDFRPTNLRKPPGTFYQTPGDILPWVEEVPAAHPERTRLLTLGKSSEGRPVLALEVLPPGLTKTANTRRLAVLCRQHGDEPEATASGAIFLHQWLESSSPLYRNLADKTALLIICISNPDGAARYQRRTAANIDMNRDWERRKSPEVKALSAAIMSWRPNLVIDVHQWDPAPRMPPPMAEASGGAVASRAAWAMAYGNKQRGFYLAARSHWGASTLCHRYFGQRAGVPAILLESRHLPQVPGARDIAIQQEVTALWCATASLARN